MSMQEITDAVMELPEEERLELARRIVASLSSQDKAALDITEAIRRLEDLMTGKVRALTEAEFRDALK